MAHYYSTQPHHLLLHLHANAFFNPYYCSDCSERNYSALSLLSISLRTPYMLHTTLPGTVHTQGAAWLYRLSADIRLTRIVSTWSRYIYFLFQWGPGVEVSIPCAGNVAMTGVLAS